MLVLNHIKSLWQSESTKMVTKNRKNSQYHP